MSTRLAIHDPQRHTDDGEEYVLIDPRAVLLDLPDEPRFESRPLRGSQPPAAAPCDPEVEWRTFLGSARRTAVADETRAASAASAESRWHRLARRLQHAFSGARAGKTRRP